MFRSDFTSVKLLTDYCFREDTVELTNRHLVVGIDFRLDY